MAANNIPISFGQTFSNMPILSFPIDDMESYYKECKKAYGSMDAYSKNLKYYQNNYLNGFFKLFFESPFPLNLGGATEKQKLVTTDRPTGVFDFSLASRGLYRIPEYYSKQFAIDYPGYYAELELPDGVVPNNMVNHIHEDGENRFVYKHGEQEFECEIRQKGQTAIDNGVPGAKLKFATRNRKVYLTYKRNRGKVRYVEIYSLFYYTSVSGDLEFAIRHMPAILLAEYLESIGIKVRIYMTRFVLLTKREFKLLVKTPKDLGLNAKYPMAEKYSSLNLPTSRNVLFFQPVIVKDFGEALNMAETLFVSSQSNARLYESLAKNAIGKEVVGGDNVRPFGYPDWSRDDYWEGMERYREKYQEYVKAGIFKSKEILPEAMVFFHDMAIKNRLSSFLKKVHEITKKDTSNSAEGILVPEINVFFSWWMRFSANNTRNKIELLNSQNYEKDIPEIGKRMSAIIDELNLMILQASKKTGAQTLNSYEEKIVSLYKDYGRQLSYDYDGYEYNSGKGEFVFNLKRYITSIANELTTYADGALYATSIERQEKMNDMLTKVFEALEKVNV